MEGPTSPGIYDEDHGVKGGGTRYMPREPVGRTGGHAKGFWINGGVRRVLTTRRDGYMRFDVLAVTGTCSVMLSTISV
jgi:hypothetical protein